MCEKAVLESCGTVAFVPNWYKNQEICNRAVDNYLNALQFVPECYKTQEMCDKVVNVHSFTIQFVHERYKTQICVIKLLINLFLAFFIFMINRKAMECVKVLFLVNLFH